MNEIVLRKLTINDVPELSTISKKTFYDSFSGTCTQPDMDDFLERYYNEKILTAEVQNEALNYYFAEVDGQTAGYILFAESSPNFTETINKKAIELKRLYVLNQFHGKSIAQKMMDFFLAYALNHTYDVAFLGVWEYNFKAQNFYKKYAFLPTKYRHDFPIGNTAQTDMYLIKKLT